MTLLYTQEQKEYIHLAQEFGDRYLTPEIIKKYDLKGDCPSSLFEPAIKIGLHMLEILGNMVVLAFLMKILPSFLKNWLNMMQVMH